jgi:hypothetical protein
MSMSMSTNAISRFFRSNYLRSPRVMLISDSILTDHHAVILKPFRCDDTFKNVLFEVHRRQRGHFRQFSSQPSSEGILRFFFAETHKARPIENTFRIQQTAWRPAVNILLAPHYFSPSPSLSPVPPSQHAQHILHNATTSVYLYARYIWHPLLAPRLITNPTKYSIDKCPCTPLGLLV